MINLISSQRPKHIVLVGLLHDTNLGDPAILQATQHSIQEYCQRRQFKVTFGHIDIGDYKDPRYRCQVFDKMYERIRHWLWHFLFKRSFTKYDRVKLACIKTIKKDSDAVVFVGGSLIKFRRQEYLHRMLEIVLSRAEKMNVPVMFSGVGVEGGTMTAAKFVRG